MLQSEHQLVIIGADWNGAEGVHRAIAKSSAVNDIIVTGYVADEELIFFYNAADLMVFPSLYEGFGLPILEAMACGTPVGCSNLSSLPEVAGDAALLFDPYDEKSIAMGMYRILSSAHLAKQLKIKGLARAQSFSWKNTARKTLDVIHRVVTSPY